MISKLNATILPLSISYRCPTSHIEQAKCLVEAIEAREGAEQGVFSVIKYDYAVGMLTAGDMIICRTNAPLIPIAFHLVRLGIKAMVRGRDIGQGLVALVRRFKAASIRDFVVMLEEYKEKEIERLGRRKNSEMAIESVQDKCETLQAIAASCDSMEEVEHKIESIFSDDNASVTLSSIHRAKGLEASRVFVLHPELLPHPRAKQPWQVQQELNAKYVALTRSKSELYFVEGGS
jgi:DNA helicase II / ATP-dependent DNA helicase PcrA